MPGWYEKLESEISDSRLQVIGLIQEQHPRRTELFNQWRNLEMTLLSDPLNALDVKVVPIVLLVDETGVIRRRNPSIEQVQEFLQRPAVSSNDRLQETWVPGQEWSVGDQRVLAGQFEEALRYYQRELSDHSESARLNFRLGVAYRMKYDSRHGAPEDFGRAVYHWRKAIQLDPNQYIWRRRIQQYGPVLDKPYPFYHWVEEARDAVLARGEQPISLSVEPRGAELVGPQGVAKSRHEPTRQPDPLGEIQRDKGAAVKIQGTVVRATEREHRGLRLHLCFELNSLGGYAWNNEAEPIQVWLHLQEGLQLNSQLMELPLPTSAVSEERRAVDVDVRWEQGSPPTCLTGYVLYNICHKENGSCLLRRQDLNITLPRN